MSFPAIPKAIEDKFPGNFFAIDAVIDDQPWPTICECLTKSVIRCTNPKIKSRYLIFDKMMLFQKYFQPWKPVLELNSTCLLKTATTLCTGFSKYRAYLHADADAPAIARNAGLQQAVVIHSFGRLGEQDMDALKRLARSIQRFLGEQPTSTDDQAPNR